MVIYLRDTSVKTPLGIREKIEENNISLETFQDKNGYNVTCLDGENLCLKGANTEKKQKFSIYVSYSEFWNQIYFIHRLEHSVPFKTLKILKDHKLAYPNMYTNVRLYLMVVSPLYPGISTNQTKPLDKYRGKETIPLSFIIDSTPTLYKTSSGIGTPIIFSPIINKLQLLPSTLNFIPMSVSVPELFNEPYLHTFNSLPLYKSNSFVICIGRFNNNENWSIPFYLIIVVDINYIKIDNHYLLNS
ncbi:hypothetical protein ACTFIR_012858 [Dictyostelium discoideum]